jgi:small subunit ribosomal protein S1
MSEETKNLETAAAEQQPETAAEAITEQNLDQMVTLKKGDKVKGTVIKIENNQAYVSLGYKYDGVIPLRELSAVPLENAADAVQVGQEVELKVLSIDDDKERLVLSKRQVDAEKAWDRLKEQYEKGEVLEVTVADVVKGGLVVDVGVRGFIPASMVERHYVEDFSDYKGRKLRVKIKELDRETNKVILSA